MKAVVAWVHEASCTVCIIVGARYSIRGRFLTLLLGALRP